MLDGLGEKDYFVLEMRKQPWMAQGPECTAHYGKDWPDDQAVYLLNSENLKSREPGFRWQDARTSPDLVTMVGKQRNGYA